MNDINQQCLSLANGVLSPDQRVNYEFGLVLGVNEFRQEQEYFLEKNYLYNRELHGFGTVSGLKVTLQTPSDNTNEREITIDPGMAIDQWGRSIVVRNTLCAHLQAWLAKQDQDPNNLNHVASHLDADGNGHVYIVASYQAYPDDLVPVPGQGCSSETKRAASRIHDSYTIELTWTKPGMATWDAEHCFAQLLAQIRLMPETGASDEQKIIEYIRQLDQPCPEAFPGTLSQDFLQLPAFRAREALDRIFTVWVTEMRPKLHPDLLNPDNNATVDNPAILLASIDLILQKGTTSNTAWQILSAQANDEGRPFLLNTQLAQETILQSKLPEPEREFATLQARDNHTLRLWVHHPDLVQIHQIAKGDLAQMQIQSEDTTRTISNVSAVSNTRNVFDITVAEAIPSEARLALTFILNAITTSDDQGVNPRLLQIALDALNFAYVGHDRVANTITIYSVAAYPVAPPPQLSITDIINLPTHPFVTVTTLSASPPKFELWFHLNLDPASNSVFIQDASPCFVTIEPSSSNDSTQSIKSQVDKGSQRNIFTLTPSTTKAIPLTPPTYLRLVFPVDQLQVQVAANNVISLRAYMQQQNIKFEGYNGKDAIVAYVSIPSA
ncbi:hypothetical protein [Dictyobacter formicarum]|uniref:Uncharacterized protein n=1 Tax=Dictyobacter formicarum TaxID=2778368 RepID=A0ABQ3VPK4_9CHLR|nr:hypothetical protein [Dictyobacter formicarum]GHO87619.1 hypothetical protein KSZ_56250 [Dictyobacter formicarum]